MKPSDIIMIFCVIFLFVGAVTLAWGIGQTFPRTDIRVVNVTTENITELKNTKYDQTDTICISDVQLHNIQCMWRLGLWC